MSRYVDSSTSLFKMFLIIVMCLFSINIYASEIAMVEHQMRTVDVLKWEKYTFKREFKKSKDGNDYVKLRILFNGKVVKSFDAMSNGNIAVDRQYSFISLYQLLPGPNKQAVVYCSGGGKDHNGSYSILDLSPDGNIAELFDSDLYLTEGYYDFIKSDKVENMVLVDDIEPWSVFLFSDAETPRVHVYFAYNKERRKYLPRKFISPDVSKADSWGDTRYDRDELAIVISQASEYWFDGRNEDGWAFFEKHYVGKDKREVSQKIKEIMKKNKYIKALNLP